ncbi:unnamed protein product, partial [Ascophyllum nodosum]
MSSASPSPTLPPATDVLLASPLNGPPVCTPSLRSTVIASPARSVLPDRSLRLSSETPTVQSLQLNPKIEIRPQLSGSLVAPTTAPMTCASSLTERALRSQRRDALRALRDAAIPFPSSPMHLHEATRDFGAQIEYLTMQPSTPRQTTPIHNHSNSVHNHSNSVPARRATMHVADHPPFTVRVIPPRVFTPLASLRASSNTMPATTTSAASSPQKTTAASPAHTAPLPQSAFSPTPSPDLRANTGSRTATAQLPAANTPEDGTRSTEKLSSGIGGPAAFKTLLTDFADYLDRAPRGAALATLQNFGVRTGTPFASYLRALRVVVAGTVEKGGP